MKGYFLNQSQLGAFGEFVYKTHCESLGLQIDRTNFCHTDFLVQSKGTNQSYYVDVKSTLSDKKKYQGKRYHDNIAYELLLILRGRVLIVPDHNSPLQSKSRHDLGEFSDWLAKWQENSEIAHKKESKLDDSIIMELKDLFSQMNCPRLRIVERGDASGKRWTGTVDNLPGSSTVIDSKDVTVFFKFGCEDFKEKISKIYLIWHSLLHAKQIKMQKPDSRQTKKGITEVIDLTAFTKDYPNLVFDNLDSIKSYLKNEVIGHK